MYLTVKQQLKHLSKQEYRILRELCHAAKNLTNEAIYNIRQYYFANHKYLSYSKNYQLLKSSSNYRTLNSNMAEQILKEVDGNFKSFFGLLKKAGRKEYSYRDIRLPGYLPKDGYTTLIVGFVRLNGNRFLLPYSNGYKKSHQPIMLTIPSILTDKSVKEIRIIPKANARYFEVQYTYEVEDIEVNLNPNNALALDLGINNLVTAAANDGKCFIIDGKRLKSVNHWYNKQNARLQSIKDKQHFDSRKITNRQASLARKRNNIVNDYMSKTARMILNYCIQNDIGTLVIGYNETFQRNSNIGKQNNQNFVNIPYGKLFKKLKYLCEQHHIRFVKQEESYTSKASFWDQDEMPVYNESDPATVSFSGKRIHRGMYLTASGKTLNADVNGALNILRKSNVVSLSALYSKGEVDTPVRIRVA